MSAAVEVNPDNPWPGLSAYTESMQSLFFGRGADIDALARLVRRDDCSLLFGQSGLGKTSLLQAGLYPRLRMHDMLPVPIRIQYGSEHPAPRDQILAALRKAAPSGSVEIPEPVPGETLWEYFFSAEHEFWSGENELLTPVLVVDQFEEIFTLGLRGPAATAQRDSLLEELSSLATRTPPPKVKGRFANEPHEAERYPTNQVRCRVLLAMREDFLPEMDGLKDRFPSLRNNAYRLLGFNGTQAEDVLKLAGAHLLDPDVVVPIVRFVAAERGRRADSLAQLSVDPALLSVVARGLNERRKAAGQPCITDALLTGKREEILSGFYEEALHGLGPEVRMFIENELLTSSGFRNSCAVDDAVSRFGISRVTIDTLVTERRLLRIEERAQTARIELTHDLLIEVVRESRDRRRLAEREAATRREAERLADQAREQAAAREEAAQQQLEATRQRLRAVRRRWLLGAVCFLALTIYLIQWINNRSMVREARVLDQERGKLSAEVEARAKAVRDLMLVRIQEAVNAGDSNLARRYLYLAEEKEILSSEEARVYAAAFTDPAPLDLVAVIPTHETKPTAVRFASDNRSLLVLANGRLRRLLFSRGPDERIVLDSAFSSTTLPDGIDAFTLDPTHNRVVLALKDGSVRLYDDQGNERLQLSPSLAKTTNSETEIEIRKRSDSANESSVTKAPALPRNPTRNPVESLAVSLSGKWLAAADNKGAVTVWKLPELSEDGKIPPVAADGFFQDQTNFAMGSVDLQFTYDETSLFVHSGKNFAWWHLTAPEKSTKPIETLIRGRSTLSRLLPGLRGDPDSYFAAIGEGEGTIWRLPAGSEPNSDASTVEESLSLEGELQKTAVVPGSAKILILGANFVKLAQLDPTKGSDGKREKLSWNSLESDVIPECTWVDATVRSDGRFAAGLTKDGTIMIWELREGLEFKSSNPEGNPHDSSIHNTTGLTSRLPVTLVDGSKVTDIILREKSSAAVEHFLAIGVVEGDPGNLRIFSEPDLKTLWTLPVSKIGEEQTEASKDRPALRYTSSRFDRLAFWNRAIRKIQIHDAHSGRIQTTLPIPEIETDKLSVEQLIWSPNGERLGALLSNGALVCWPVDLTGTPNELGVASVSLKEIGNFKITSVALADPSDQPYVLAMLGLGDNRLAVVSFPDRASNPGMFVVGRPLTVDFARAETDDEPVSLGEIDYAPHLGELRLTFADHSIHRTHAHPPLRRGLFDLLGEDRDFRIISQRSIKPETSLPLPDETSWFEVTTDRVTRIREAMLASLARWANDTTVSPRPDTLAAAIGPKVFSEIEAPGILDRWPGYERIVPWLADLARGQSPPLPWDEVVEEIAKGAGGVKAVDRLRRLMWDSDNHWAAKPEAAAYALSWLEKSAANPDELPPADLIRLASRGLASAEELSERFSEIRNWVLKNGFANDTTALLGLLEELKNIELLEQEELAATESGREDDVRKLRDMVREARVRQWTTDPTAVIAWLRKHLEEETGLDAPSKNPLVEKALNVLASNSELPRSFRRIRDDLKERLFPNDTDWTAYILGFKDADFIGEEADAAYERPDWGAAHKLYRQAWELEPNRFRFGLRASQSLRFGDREREALPLYREIETRARATGDQSALIDSLIGQSFCWEFLPDANADQQAEALLRQAIDLDPAQTSSYVWLADFLAGVGRPREALAAYQEAYRRDPEDKSIRLDLARVALQAGDRNVGLREIEVLATQNRDSPRELIDIANALREDGSAADLRRAADLLQSALNAATVDDRCYAISRLIPLQFRQGNVMEALANEAALRDAFSKSPDSKADLGWGLSELGVIHLHSRDFSRAIERLDESYTISPDPWILERLCYAHVWLHRDDLARKEAQKAIAKNPIYLVTLATVQAQGGAFAEAMETISPALHHGGWRADANLKYGIWLEKLGRAEAAQTNFGLARDMYAQANKVPGQSLACAFLRDFDRSWTLLESIATDQKPEDLAQMRAAFFAVRYQANGNEQDRVAAWASLLEAFLGGWSGLTPLSVTPGIDVMANDPFFPLADQGDRLPSSNPERYRAWLRLVSALRVLPAAAESSERLQTLFDRLSAKVELPDAGTMR